MCGILGIVDFNNNSVDLKNFNKSLELLKHRGPDDEGYLLFNKNNNKIVSCGGQDSTIKNIPKIDQFLTGKFNIVFGHRRLSIIDLSDAAHQPMVSNCGKYWIVFNGEIYNYIELKRELIKKGHRFFSSSDTEVILAAYEQWGKNMLKKFIGMFAFAILDLKQNTILLCRDFFGIKPLYYAFLNGLLAFSSEISSLLHLTGIQRRPNPFQLYRYLRFGLIDGEKETLFKGINEVQAAHYLETGLSNKSINYERYWNLNLNNKIDITFKEASGHLNKLFQNSIDLHLRSDVSLGTCISGGLDSTSILMMMNNNNSCIKPINCFSFITDDPILSEERFVNIAGNVSQSIINKVHVSPDELAYDFETLVRAQELPFGSTSIYAQYRVFQEAKKHGITVMLDGQGSDEIFGGYYNFLGARIAGLFASGQFINAARILTNTPNNMKQHFYHMLIASLGRLLNDSYSPLLRQLVGESFWPSWICRDWFEERDVFPTERLRGKGKDSLREEMVYSIFNLSLPQLLRYEDRNSMNFSIESRVPFCVKEIAEFSLGLPDEFLISKNGITKHILKHMLKEIVPVEIINREKVGFGTPEKSWLKALIPYIENTMLSVQENSIPFLNNAKEKVNLAITKKGRWDSHAWRIFNIIAWLKVFKIEIEH